MRYLSDIIGETYKSWNPSKPIIINTPTGSGKTYFILNTLLKYAFENNKRIVYLTNRNALRNQVKKEVPQEYQNNILIMNYQKFSTLPIPTHSTTQSYLPIPVLQPYQPLSLYQPFQLPSFTDLSQESIFVESADYFILDEAHYLLADSDYNDSIVSCTQNIDHIKEINHHAVWIAMTATPGYFCLWADILNKWDPEYKIYHHNIDLHEYYLLRKQKKNYIKSMQYIKKCYLFAKIQL